MSNPRADPRSHLKFFVDTEEGTSVDFVLSANVALQLGRWLVTQCRVGTESGRYEIGPQSTADGSLVTVTALPVEERGE
jgi:hypothetical protein